MLYNTKYQEYDPPHANSGSIPDADGRCLVRMSHFTLYNLIS